MTSKYEKTKGTQIGISNAPVTEDDFKAAGFPTAGVTFLEAECATKEISYTGGQKSDIDVTTLCSTEQEQTNGLAAPAEMSISRNWVGDEAAQLALQTAYENDELRALKVVFPPVTVFMCWWRSVRVAGLQRHPRSLAQPIHCA
jgi:muconolactone delta-isomerase